jgi:NNP family nitrate/nitrite transporter-like MFS transporter
MSRILAALRSGHWPSLFGAWLHFEISFMIWLLIGALGVLIAKDLHLTATQKGLLVAAPLLGGALLRIVIGPCSDRYGPKPTGAAVLVCELLVLLWGWLGPATYQQVLAVSLGLGIAGASFAVALPLASRVYPPAHQGLAMGIAASANSGGMLAAFFAPRLGRVLGWQNTLAVMAVPVLLTLLLFLVLVRDPAARTRHGEGVPWWAGTIELLREPATYWFCFLYAITFGGFVGFGSFLPIFLHDQYGLDLLDAGSLTALCVLAGSLTRPMGGYAADHLGGLRLIGLLFPALAGLTIAAGQFLPIRWEAALLVLTVAVMGLGNGGVFQAVWHRFEKQIGTASGLIGAAGGLGGFLLPAGLGVLKDTTGTYRSGFLLFAVASAVAAMAVAVMRKRDRQALEDRDGRGFSR